MTQINAITNQPSQQLNLILPDNSVIENFIMRYMDVPQGWFFSLTYGDFQINNLPLVVSPNCLRAWRGVIPFGIALDTTDGYESLFIDDFSNGRASLYLLDSDDVQAVEDIIQNVS